MVTRVPPFTHLNNVFQACQISKHAREQFPKSQSQSITPIKLLHLYLCGPLLVKSMGGAIYFMTFMDDFSRKV